MSKNVLESPLAGQWYTADAGVLRNELAKYLEQVEGPALDNVMALVLPHAGYRFSGQTAAFGIKQVAGAAYRRVIVLGPSHGVPMPNAASVPDATHYATPLGEVPVDTDCIAALKAHPFFQTVPMAHAREHSVQIEVPLLQYALEDFQLVPIVVGQLDPETARAMGRALADNIDAETLVVASTDFTHYGPRFQYVPFRDNIPENLRTLDEGAIQRIQAKDLDGFLAYIDETGATVCGRHPLAVLLAMLPEPAKGHVLSYTTSGELTGDYGNSVSYASLAFTGTWPGGKEAPQKKPAESEASLEPGEKQTLLKLARETLAIALREQRLPDVSELDVAITPGMEEIRGAFVTLRQNGRLRGCIGDIFPSHPLYMSVMRNAANAALNDPRFPAMTPEELPGTDIEISALTPQKPVDSYEAIEVGRHGVVLSKAGRRAVFLPQVAPEQGWDRDTMLSHLAAKAGLPQEAWREDAQFTVFEAEVFAEEDKA